MILKIYKKILMFLLRRKFKVFGGLSNNIYIQLNHLVFEPALVLDLNSLNDITISMIFPEHARPTIKYKPYTVFYYHKDYKINLKKFLWINISLIDSVKFVEIYINYLNKYDPKISCATGDIDYKDAEHLLDCAYKNYVRKTKIENVDKKL